MSRDILADLLHLSPNTLYKMEIGERTPTLDDLKIISEEFNVDPISFFNCNGSTYIHNGDHSPGGGMNNIVGVNEELLSHLVKTLDNLSQYFAKQ